MQKCLGIDSPIPDCERRALALRAYFVRPTETHRAHPTWQVEAAVALMDGGALTSRVDNASETSPLEEALHFARSTAHKDNLRINQGVCLVPVLCHTMCTVLHDMKYGVANDYMLSLCISCAARHNWRAVEELIDCTSIMGPRAIIKLAADVSKAAMGDPTGLIGTCVKSAYVLGG